MNTSACFFLKVVGVILTGVVDYTLLQILEILLQIPCQYPTPTPTNASIKNKENII